MVVQISKGQLDWFRRKSRNTPNEIYALLIGRVVSSKKVIVTNICYPLLTISTPNGVEADLPSCEELELQANEKGLRLLGAIHNHPQYLPVMSDVDTKAHIDNKYLISGIVEVTSRRRTRVFFWTKDSSLPCELTYTKG